MRKKALALFVSLVLAIGMCIPAFGVTVKNETPGHTYDAYQVFSGTQADGDSALGDVAWGSGVNGVALLAELQKSPYFADCETAADVAGVLAGKSDDCEEAKALAAIVVNHLTTVKTTIIPSDSVELAAGYWLIVDTTNPGKGDAKNAALLQVTNKGDLVISKKYDAPQVEKKIIEDFVKVDAVDVNIGGIVTFKLTATMPSTFEGYESYKVVFHDELSSGLTFKEDSMKVMVGEEDVTKAFELAKGSNGAFTVSCDNVLAVGVGVTAGSEIVVTYEAVLNKDAVIGSSGNPNKVYLEYSNDPNWSGDGTEPTGKTPEDQVLVFTYKLDVTKVAAGEDEVKLQGAEFILYRGEQGSFEYAKVEDEKITDWTSDRSEASELSSDQNGSFKVAGLDAGAYWLEETKAPAGYNLLKEPIKVVIAATLVASQENGSALTALTISVDGKPAVDGSVETGVVSMSVENEKGIVLPSTGGVGTTLFYAVGGVLVVGAAVLLIMRRCAGSEE